MKIKSNDKQFMNIIVFKKSIQNSKTDCPINKFKLEQEKS